MKHMAATLVVWIPLYAVVKAFVPTEWWVAAGALAWFVTDEAATWWENR